MSSPVSLDTPTIFTEGKEEVRKTMKEEAQAALKKSSSQAKAAMKENMDHCAKGTATLTNYGYKVALNVTAPPSIAVPGTCVLDHSVKPSTEKVIQKLGHKSVDKLVDTTAKKAIDYSVDKVVDTSGSCLCGCFQYIINLFNSTGNHEKTN